jgi:hypothetical protein
MFDPTSDAPLDAGESNVSDTDDCALTVPVAEAELAAPRRSGRGGWRPGAGRKRKAAPPPPPEPAPLVPRTGDMVVFYQPVTGSAADWFARPAVVLWVEDGSDPQTRVALGIIGWNEVQSVDCVPFSAEPRARCWSWR